MNKKTAAIILVFVACIGGYFITKSIDENTIAEKRIVYHSSTASEVFMVWGINYLELPPQKYWPKGSYAKGGLVYTKMNNNRDTYNVNIGLPYNTILNYWMVQTKDKQGNKTDIWDSGGNDKEYTSVNFTSNQLFRPGYFIFLAGFLPLLLSYLVHRKRQPSSEHLPLFKINSYIPQFDSIRAIAVILVIIHHWFETNKILNFLPNGAIGVNIFFVLSGFLITGILLKAKKQIEAKHITLSTAFKNFYIRRTLRIFPIYYLFLLVLLIIQDPAVVKDAIYYFTYTSNFLFFSAQIFPARVAHLWSLAVEEQFYLLWPWLIILISKKLLPYLIALFLIIGISSNYILLNNGWWLQLFTPSCFDAFAIGGFLSYLIAYRQDVIQAIQPKFKWIFMCVVVVFLFHVFDYAFLPARTIHALLGITIIYYCLFKKNNKMLNHVLDNKWLMKIGKVSYGVYLYHLIVPELWIWVNKQFTNHNFDLLFNKAMPASLEPYWFFLQEVSLLIFLCMVSWYLIEKPVNNLKKHFENKRSWAVDIVQVEEPRLK